MKWLYYLPVILLLVVVIVVDEGWIKTVLGVILAIGVVFSKFMRTRTSSDEVEIDERVKTNIHSFSFGFVIVMNGLLLCYYVLVSYFEMKAWLTIDYLLLYLTISIVVPLYIIPSIAKRF